MMIYRSKLSLCVSLFIFHLIIGFLFEGLADAQNLPETWRVGSGIHDITGPVAERGMMGYGSLEQVTQGVYTRLRSRAFVIEDSMSSKRVALVVVDLGLMFDSVKQEVVLKLEKEFPGKFFESNIMISATHTHSGPGGLSHHDVFNLTTLGFDQQGFDVVTDGIYQSIRKAYLNLAPGTIQLSQDELRGASGNRSIVAYHANEDWRNFSDEIDPSFTLLKFTHDAGDEIGVLDWFAVHATCMSNKNRLISSDNKGHAAELFEREMHTNYRSDKTFVAAFSNSNEGDSSPHFALAKDSVDDFELTEKNGALQYRKARDLFEQGGRILKPRLEYRSVWMNMSGHLVDAAFARGKPQALCRAAMGYSFAAGAEDGPSEVPGFYEGMKQGLAALPQIMDGALKLLRLAIGASDEGEECQYPKPILVAAGEKNPDLLPETIPMQLIVVGSLAVIGVPSETTTMAGRRLKKMVLEELQSVGIDTVVISGLSNDYSGYVTTFEEYQEQQYEGGFTLFGPHTLGGYLQTFRGMAQAIREGREIELSPRRRSRHAPLKDLQPGVLFDAKRLWEKFGTVLDQPESSYLRGDLVNARFRAGHPKNALKVLDNFLEIQRFDNGQWNAVANDWDSETLFKWEREESLDCIACSSVYVTWKTSDKTLPGRYRIKHVGVWKSGLDRKLRQYKGRTREFIVE